MTTRKQAQEIFKELTESKQDIETKLLDLIENHEYCNKSYFWSSPLRAETRRANEEKYSKRATLELKTGVMEIQQSLTQSCRNSYYSMYITVYNLKKEEHEIFGDYHYSLKTLRQLLELVQSSLDIAA